MMVSLAQATGGFPEPYFIGAILSPVLFVGWVIISKRRTRHLTQLIRAVRGPVRPGSDPRTRRRTGR